jgi:hypothetical protein
MAQIHVVGLNAGRFENLGGSNDSGGLVVQPAGATAPALELRHAGSGSGLTIALTGSGYGLTVTGGNVGFGTATPGYQVEIASTLKVGTYADFPGIANPAAPAAGTVRFHATTANGLTRFEQDNEAATNLVLGRDNVVIAKNTSGSIIAAGTPVYVTGATGNVPNIGLAKADVVATLPAIGVALDSIGINAFGQVMGAGIITSINTSAYAVGAPLYVSATTAGALTDTRPVSPNLAQRIGSVLVSGVGNGTIEVVTAPFVGGLESGTTAGFTIAGALNAKGNSTLGDAGTDTLDVYPYFANFRSYTAAPAWVNTAFGTTLMTAGVKLNDPTSATFPTVATLKGGSVTAGTDKAGGVLLLGGDSTVATDGGPILIVGGSSTVGGLGGAVFVASGQPGPTGKSGDLNLATWSGGATSGDSGKLDMSTGSVTSGTSGVVSLVTGTGTTASGQITLRSGNATTTSGSVSIYTGTGATVGAINIGASGGVAAVNLGQAGHTTTVTGALAVNQAGAANAITVSKTVTAAGTGLSVSMASVCTWSGISVAQLGSGDGLYVSKSGVAGVGGNGVTILMDTTSTGYALQVTGGNASGIYATASAGGLGVGKSVLWVESTSGSGDAATIRAIGGTGGALSVSASTSTALACSSGTAICASLSRSSTGGNSVNITHAGTAAGDNALYVAPGAVTAGHGISVNCPSMNGGHGIYISYAGGAGSAISISQGATTGPAIAVSNSATSGPLMNLSAASGSNTSYGATISVAGSGTALIAAVTGSGTGRVAEFNAPSNKSVRVLNNGTIEIDGGASPVGRAFHRVVGASRMISGILAAVVGSTHGAAVSGAYLGAYGALDGALLIPLELPDGSALYGFSIYVSIGNTGFNTSTAGVYLARVTGGASSTQEYFDDTTNTWGAGTEYTQVRSGAPVFFTAGPTGAAGLTNPQTLDRANYDYYLRVRFTSSLGNYQDGTIRGRCYHADLWGQWLKLSPGP